MHLIWVIVESSLIFSGKLAKNSGKNVPRLFTGIKIPDNIAQMLILKRGKINGSRWVERHDLHVTLRFIGDIDEAMARDVEFELGLIQHNKMQLVLDRLDVFGSKKPRTLFAKVGKTRNCRRFMPNMKKQCTISAFNHNRENMHPMSQLPVLVVQKLGMYCGLWNSMANLYQWNLKLKDFLCFQRVIPSVEDPIWKRQIISLIENFRFRDVRQTSDQAIQWRLA